ncbi:MAG: cytochrome c peroxidase [Kofleriaceae bacterium]
MRIFISSMIVMIACHDEPATPIATAIAPTPVATIDAQVSVPANTRHKRVHDKADPAAPSAQEASFYYYTWKRTPPPAELAQLGSVMFRDTSLSHDKSLSCASCHDPAHAFAPTTEHEGLRQAPSLRYLQAVPQFTEHFVDPELDNGEDQGPAGGLTWDGRAKSLHDQALVPLMGPDEMANTSQKDLVATLAKAPYAEQMKQMFGDDLFGNDNNVVKALLLSLEVYQQTPDEFYPYSSKYDHVIHGKAALTPQEARGRALFDDPKKGNCQRCHPDTGVAAPFTDFGFVALGVPARGKAIDLGLCGPRRTDLASHSEYCGKFRTPSLRNVATRKRFFHNGSVTSLRDAVKFYAARDLKKADLPAQYRGNLEPIDVKLTDAEINDIVAFLGTLTDADQRSARLP